MLLALLHVWLNAFSGADARHCHGPLLTNAFARWRPRLLLAGVKDQMRLHFLCHFWMILRLLFQEGLENWILWHFQWGNSPISLFSPVLWNTWITYKCMRATLYLSYVSGGSCVFFRFHNTVSNWDQTVSQREATMGILFSASHTILKQKSEISYLSLYSNWLQSHCFSAMVSTSRDRAV